MDTKQPEALRLAYTLDLLAMDMKTPRMAATELRRQHAEIETLRAGYSAACIRSASLPMRADATAVAQTTAGAVQQDAERYRWLRDHRGWQVLHRIRPGKSIEYRMRDDGDWWGHWWPTHEQAIDAARAAQKVK